MHDRIACQGITFDDVLLEPAYSDVVPADVDVRTQEQQAVITVRDQGVGIPTDELPHIFTRFFRASTVLGVQGTGIGLAGSRAIIEQHHGHITVESEVGQGTTVTVRLPRSADESNAPATPYRRDGPENRSVQTRLGDDVPQEKGVQ